MAITLPSITVTDNADITTDALEIGDQATVKTKMDARDVKINTLIQQVRTLSQQVSTLRDESEDALNLQDANTVALDPDQFSHNLISGSGSLLEDYEGNAGGYINADDNEFDGGQLSNFATTYNGSDIDGATEVGRYYYNSSTNGGANPAIEGAAITFSEKMHDQMALVASVQKRYVPGFAVAEIIAGTGEAGTSYDNRFGLWVNPNAGRASSQSTVSVSIWFQPVDDYAYILASSGTRNTYIDGVITEAAGGDDGTGFYKLNQGQVYHLAASLVSSAPLSNLAIPVYVAPSSRNYVALPRVGSGAFQMQPHAWPVSSTVTSVRYLEQLVFDSVENAENLTPIVTAAVNNSAALEAIVESMSSEMLGELQTLVNNTILDNEGETLDQHIDNRLINTDALDWLINSIPTLEELPAGLLEYDNQIADNIVSGSVENLPSGLTYCRIQGQNTTDGDIGQLPSGLTYYLNGGYNTTDGDIGQLPSGVTVYINTGYNTTDGDISQLPSGVTYYSNTGYNTCTCSSVPIFSANMIQFKSNGSLTTAEVDRVLEGLANTTWTSTKVVNLTSNNPPSAAAQVHIDALIAMGVSVLTD